MRVETTLVSVSDKRGLVDFVKRLLVLEIGVLASPGTAEFLRSNSLDVRSIEEITGRALYVGGRIKTLHPAIHAGILARRDFPSDIDDVKALGGCLFDMVVCNFYDFADDPVCENIDIGGPAMIRAAAKNWKYVVPVISPFDYDALATELENSSSAVSAATRKKLAASVFSVTARYDSEIAGSLAIDKQPGEGFPPEYLSLKLRLSRKLKYGENPHQKAALYVTDRGRAGTDGNAAAVSASEEKTVDSVRDIVVATTSTYTSEGGVAAARLVKGKRLSYNNLLDADAAWRAVCPLERPAACVVKHQVPCGLAVDETPAKALERALRGDPLSAFGGIIALNCEFDANCSRTLKKAGIFTELIAAPSFSRDALAGMKARKRLRCIAVEEACDKDAYEIRSIQGGWLVQEADGYWLPDDVTAVGRVEVPSSAVEDIHLAWHAVGLARSNAIVIVKDSAVVGVGAGQTSRVDAVRRAVGLAGDRAAGAVLASDAFFPFSDSINLAAEARISGIVQPGGSRRDTEVIRAADDAGLFMVFTARRCFRH